MTDFLIRVAQFAAKAHAGQVRKYNGRPYIEHPMRVAGAVMLRPDVDKGGIGEQIVAAAWLHDTLEDTQATVEQILEFGPVTATIVQELTHPPLSMGNRVKRRELYFGKLAGASEEAKIIKMVDRIDNLDDMYAEFAGGMCEGDALFAELYAHESLLLAGAVGAADQPLNDALRAVAHKLIGIIPH
jgi:(p)ppGpp synthase/HD superfamily hydrolase